MKKTIRLITLLLTLSLIWQLRTTNAQGSSFRYAYLSNDESHGLQLFSVDPNSPANVTPFITFPLGANETIVDSGTFSPDGRLLPVFVSTDKTNPSPSVPFNVRILNIDGTFSTVLMNVFGLDLENAPLYGASALRPQWSPDGRYLALLVRPNFSLPNGDLDENNDIYIYDSQTKLMRNITNHVGIHGQFSWSPDSQKLAFATIPCSQTCQPRLDIFDVSAAKLIFSSSVNVVETQGLSADKSLCLFAWSPDSTKLVYRVNCGSTPELYYQELHTFDLSTGIQARLTNYTRPLQTAQETYFAKQFPVWYDSDLILVGGYKSLTMPLTESITENGYIETYSFSSKAQTELAEGKYISEWAASGQAGEYAVVEQDPGSNGFTNPAAKTELVSYKNNALQVTRTLPTGCQMEWSPDKAYLTYYQYTDPNQCNYGGQTSQVFYNASTGQTASLPAVSPPQLVPVGWVKLTGTQLTPIPTSTNTSVLHLTPVCSPKPDLYRVWHVTNTTNADVVFNWQVVGTAQFGTALAKASSDTTFQTSTPASDPNTVSISINGVLQDMQTSDPTQCGAPSPAPTATFTPTPTLTPTPIPTLLKLTSLCSSDPATSRTWRVRNANNSDIPFTWDVYGTSQTGSGVAKANGDTIFQTTTVPNSPNTVRLFVNQIQQAVKASGGAQCATPTPTMVPHIADLSLTMIVTDVTPTVGEVINYVITYGNHGPDTANNVKITSPLPVGVTLQSANDGSYDPVTGVWTIGDVMNGQNATLSLQVQVNAGTAGQSFTAIASISADSTDPNPTNNSTSASISVQR